MEYLKLLENSFQIAAGDECPPHSRLDFLSQNIFDFTTYDNFASEFLARKALEACEAITAKRNFEYHGASEENYIWYLTMVNMPFFIDKLEWGTSIRGAWWYGNPITIESYGLWQGDEQMPNTIEFTESEWLKFMLDLQTFANLAAAPSSGTTKE